LTEAKEYIARQEELKRQQEAAALAAAAAAAQQGSTSASASESTANTSSSSSSGVTGDLNPTPSTGVSGADIVAYAKQYVGYPYTWGGTDPANGGADCSGFVYYVFKHFGINYGRLTSAGYRTVGQEVSYSNIQPGDVVCYAGHVAIYAGNGLIVEAQSTSAGITCSRSVNVHSIITIRRLI
jgi:cell wall-associated NlpC family hydrolase